MGQTTSSAQESNVLETMTNSDQPSLQTSSVNSKEIQPESSREIIDGSYADNEIDTIKITDSTSEEVENFNGLQQKIQTFLNASWTYIQENPIIVISVSAGVFLIIICLIITCCFCKRNRKTDRRTSDSDQYDQPEDEYARNETIPFGSNKSKNNSKKVKPRKPPKSDENIDEKTHIYQNVRPVTPDRNIKTPIIQNFNNVQKAATIGVPLLGLSNNSSPQQQQQTVVNSINMIEDDSEEQQEMIPKPKPRSKGGNKLLTGDKSKRNTIR